MNMKAEDLFAEAVLLLDKILMEPSAAVSICGDLWNDTFVEYRGYDGNVGTDDTQAEVAMLFYALMLPLAIAPHSHYRKTARLLHGCIHRYYTEGCKSIEQRLLDECKKHNDEMADWMNGYFVSPESLTSLLEATLGRNKRDSNGRKNNGRAKIENPTINYTCTAREKTKRVDTVMRLLRHWGYVDAAQDVNHFQDAFSGNDLKLNVKWTGDSVLLYFMIKQLLEQPFVKEQKTASATAIVSNILGRTPSYSKKRLTEERQEKIKTVIYALNPRKPELNLTRNDAVMPDATEGYDDAYIAEQVAKAGELSVTKDLKKSYGR